MPEPSSLNFLIEPPPIEEFLPCISFRIAEGKAALKAKALRDKKAYQGKPRSPEVVNGVVLHQMGFSRGDAIEKYYPVTAHFIVTRNGAIAQLHDFEESLYASNFLNGSTIAIEFAGNLRNDRGRWWQGGSSEDLLAPEQVAAGRYILDIVRSYGIRKVYAHRQATGGRRANCCGPEIWRSIAEHAILNLGYEDTRDKTFGPGSKIPETWRT